MNYDGSIRIDTKMDAKGFNDGIKQIVGSVDKLSGTVKNFGSTWLALMAGRTVFDSLLSGLSQFNLMWSSMGKEIFDLNWAFGNLQGAWANLLATAIEPMIPYLIQVVKWLTGIVQYATLLIAAFLGLDKTMGSIARKTDMLAAFDKINKLSSEVAPPLSPAAMTVPPDMKLKAEAIWASIRKIFNWDAIWGDIKQTWNDIAKGDWAAVLVDLGNIWYDIGQIFTWDDLWNALKDAWNFVGQYTWQDLWNDLQGWWFKIGQIYTWDDLKKNLSDLGGWFNNFWAGIATQLGDAWYNIGQLYTWDDLKANLAGLADWFKGIFNGLIDLINKLLTGIAASINGTIGSINAIGGAVPGFHPIPNVSPNIMPHLATGGVIPPNAKFLAMLGDQTSGKNIEAPEGLLRQIVAEELSKQSININFTGSMAQLAKVLKPHIDREAVRIGNNLIKHTGQVPIS